MSHTGLVLSGGGARGAYQAGVVQGISEIAAKLGLKNPFSIYSGVSAGAINAGFLSAECHDFQYASEKLSLLWSNLDSDQVFRSDALSIGRIGTKWIKDLSFGGIAGNTLSPSLLDTAPLKDLILKNLDFHKIDQRIKEQTLRALVITAVDYTSSMAVSFVQGEADLPNWQRSRRFSQKTPIHADHIMASSAIPVLFPPIKVDQHYYGDGCIRNMAPLSPAIHLGADRIIVVGVRRQTNISEGFKTGPQNEPTIARIANVLLNAVLLDGIELDVDRLQKINDFMERVPENLRDHMNFRPIELTWIHPSVDIGHLAFENARKLPRLVRYLLKGLGSTEDAKEIISYLLFDPEFCTQLIEIGYKDAFARRAEIEKILQR